MAVNINYYIFSCQCVVTLILTKTKVILITIRTIIAVTPLWGSPTIYCWKEYCTELGLRGSENTFILFIQIVIIIRLPDCFNCVPPLEPETAIRPDLSMQTAHTVSHVIALSYLSYTQIKYTCNMLMLRINVIFRNEWQYLNKYFQIQWLLMFINKRVSGVTYE